MNKEFESPEQAQEIEKWISDFEKEGEEYSIQKEELDIENSMATFELDDLALFEAINKGKITSYDNHLEERQAIDNSRI